MDSSLSSVIAARARLAAVEQTGLVAGRQDRELSLLARDARRLLDVPAVYVSILDEERQILAAADGLTGSLAEEGGSPLSHSFCLHTVEGGTTLVVPDARRHPLLRDNPAIAERGVIAYVGVPLITSDRQAVGALCAQDSAPRAWTPGQIGRLEEFAQIAVMRIEHLRRMGHGSAG